MTDKQLNIFIFATVQKWIETLQYYRIKTPPRLQKSRNKAVNCEKPWSGASRSWAGKGLVRQEHNAQFTSMRDVSADSSYTTKN